jgi:hypothetical protein
MRHAAGRSGRSAIASSYSRRTPLWRPQARGSTRRVESSGCRQAWEPRRCASCAHSRAILRRSSRFSASSVKLAARTHSLAWYSAISLSCVLDDISASPWDEWMIHVEPFAAVIAVGNLLSVMNITTRHNGSRCRENILRAGKRTHSGPPRRTGFGRFDTHSELASGVAGGFRPITFTFRGKALWLRGKASGKLSAAASPRLPFAASRPHRKPPRRFDSEG